MVLGGGAISTRHVETRQRQPGGAEIRIQPRRLFRSPAPAASGDSSARVEAKGALRVGGRAWLRWARYSCAISGAPMEDGSSALNDAQRLAGGNILLDGGDSDLAAAALDVAGNESGRAGHHCLLALTGNAGYGGGPRAQGCCSRLSADGASEPGLQRAASETDSISLAARPAHSSEGSPERFSKRRNAYRGGGPATFF